MLLKIEPVAAIILVIIGFLAVMIGITFIVGKKNADTKEDETDASEDYEEENEEGEELGEPDIERARVLDLYIKTGYSGGGRNAKHGIAFLVKFLTDSGEEKIFAVPRELFDTLKKEDEGVLVTFGKNFIDFGDGEDIEE